MRDWKQEQSGLPAMQEWMIDEAEFVSRHIDEMFMGRRERSKSMDVNV